jgi:predicted MFS family arabinose efflux permease
MRTEMQRFARVTILTLAALASATAALAQDHYPSRTVRLVVGFGAGGPTDIPARHIADKLGTLLGQQVGWRAAFAVVTGIFLLATVCIALFVPKHPGRPVADCVTSCGCSASGRCGSRWGSAR